MTATRRQLAIRMHLEGPSSVIVIRKEFYDQFQQGDEESHKGRYG
jgi:sRNA-binding carbon storage regulator CsrA